MARREQNEEGKSMITDRDGDESTADGDDADAQVPHEDHGDIQVAIGARVRVHPGTDAESCGVVIDDFGEAAGHEVSIGASQIVGGARRWAVVLDNDDLVFVDSEQIGPE